MSLICNDYVTFYWGFIDGSLMRISPPPGSNGVYYTRKQFNGMNSQYYVDSRLCIHDYFVGKWVLVRAMKEISFICLVANDRWVTFYFFFVYAVFHPTA